MTPQEFLARSRTVRRRKTPIEDYFLAVFLGALLGAIIALQF